MENKIQKDISLSTMTTIGLGGLAKEFIECGSEEDVLSALSYASEKDLPVHILGGGSNTVFADKGFDGLVIKIGNRGVSFNEKDGVTYVSANAGESWDNIVEQCVNRGLAGFECLSGIPGLVGAAPVQNIGAYGQDVAQLITQVNAINVSSLQKKTFSHEECKFGYRTSRFKESISDIYAITSVIFKTVKCDHPNVTYPEIIERLGGEASVATLDCSAESLKQIRNVVLDIRGSKSMVSEEASVNSKSCGSFFMNPIISKSKLDEVQSKVDEEIPNYKSEDLIKIPAAWLIEKAGFPKGYRYGGVGVSSQHNLAIVNIDGTTTEVLALARDIQDAVKDKFDIQLVSEPHLVPYAK
jgi:UDP-N-acetylmuramate dehydrogenase